jgi:type IV secretion system protein VirD4
LSQLQALYGQRWESFLANAGIIQAFTPNDLKTAEYLSKRIGETTVQKTSYSSGYSGGQSSSSTTTYEAKELIYPVDDVLRYPAEQQIIFKYGEPALFMEKNEDYYKNPSFSGLFDSDPYHRD